MFHLLVGVDPTRGKCSFRKDRVVTYTSKTVLALVMDKGVLSPGVLKYPALFMQEIVTSKPPSDPSQMARVGKIVEFEIDGTNGASITFSVDPHIPPIQSQSLLVDRAVDLDVDLDRRSGVPFEFMTTHWAIKDADLYSVLYRQALIEQPRPRISGVERVLPIDPEQVSVMIRFRPDFDQVFESVKAAAESEGFKCHRVSDIWERDAIIADIASLIMRSRVVVADLTDRNANVFYECGFAHGVGREVIPITQDKADNFDVQHLRHVEYRNTGEGREDLTRKLLARFKAIRLGSLNG
jgi:hypothetical protein